MNFRHLLLLAFLLAFSVVAGCSTGEIPIAPGDSPDANSRDYTSISTYPGGHNLGSYTLMLDETAGTVELIQTDRTAQKDVTVWASVVIEGYHFDPVFSNWEIDARITNHTPFTGWGVDVVFTELADKTIVGQDGYLFINVNDELKRCPVIAYSKFTPERIFQPQHSDVRKIIIHIPPDAPGLNPIQFFIDAWWPGARHEPYVEDLKIEPIPAQGNYHISAHVRDWQMPYSHQMEVKGIIPIDGSEDPFVFTLYDDGQHGDGGNNDYIWGADFNFPYPNGKYLLIVKAWDPEDNSFENDIWFHHEGGPPQCDPIQHWKIDEGIHGNIEAEDTWVFYNEPPFVEWWELLMGDTIPPPPIFWQYHQVFGITLGERPTTGYWIRIDEVCIDNDEDIIHVDYTEMIPGEGCKVSEVLTTPYIAMGMMRWEDIPVEFHKNVKIYDCPEPECVNFEEIDQGNETGHAPALAVFNDFPSFHAFWQVHKPGVPPPEINFENHTVVAILAGDKPTTGYFIEVDWICKVGPEDDSPWKVHFTLMIPADNCPVEPGPTRPYQIVISQKFEGPVEWEDAHIVYDCPEPDCLEFELLVNGQHSGWHEKNTSVITCPYGWAQFWQVHSPYTDPPEINWAEYMIVALAMGDHPTTGYSVHLDEICWCDIEDAWRIDYTIEIPGDSCDEAQIITQPYAYYVVERADGEFFFIEHEHVYECDD